MIDICDGKMLNNLVKVHYNTFPLSPMYIYCRLFHIEILKEDRYATKLVVVSEVVFL